MKKVKINIIITTILFILLVCILRRILLGEKTITLFTRHVLYEGLFFFLAYGLWKIIGSVDDEANPYYCL
jgi:hypothetical protein